MYNLTDDHLNGTHGLPCSIINASYQHGCLPCGKVKRLDTWHLRPGH